MKVYDISVTRSFTYVINVQLYVFTDLFLRVGVTQ